MNLQLHIYDRRKSHPAALTTKKYGVGKELFKASFSREYLLMKRNSFVHIFMQACTSRFKLGFC
jgi:hypothetical protein